MKTRKNYFPLSFESRGGNESIRAVRRLLGQKGVKSLDFAISFKGQVERKNATCQAAENFTAGVQLVPHHKKKLAVE